MYNLHVANLPAEQNKSSSLTPRAQKIRKLLIAGYTPHQIKEKVKNPKLKRTVERQAYRLLATDLELQQIISEEAKGVLIGATPGAARAISKRSHRGRVDAAKLVFEASGFHNPRVEHQHSGDIQVSLAIPRPKQVEEAEEPVVDAEVVDE